MRLLRVLSSSLRHMFPQRRHTVGTGEVDPRVSTLAAVEKALTKAGIEFIPADERRGDGVRLARPG
jgi:hypothetical protein